MKAIIFDLFGTLIDLRSDELAHKELSKYLSLIHGTFNFEEHLRLYHEYASKGLSSVKAVWKALEKLACIHNFSIKLSMKDIEELHIKYHVKYSILFNDAIKALEMAKRAVDILGLVSDADVAVVNAILEHLGIKKYFNAIVTSEELSIRKPDPRLFLEVSRRLSVRPEKCVVIGDSWKDVEGGKKAGMKVVLLLRSGKAKWSSPYKPDYEAKDLVEAVSKALEALEVDKH